MLAFIDVSGDPYSLPDKSSWIALNIVGIRKRAIYDITAAFYKFKKDILQNEYIEIKSTDLINKSTLTHTELRKYEFLERVMYDCMDNCDVLHASISFKNSGNNQKSNEDHLPKHYVDALWRVEAMARYWHVNDVLVCIDNNTRHIDKKLAFAFNNYLYKTRSGSVLQNILPVPIFADSETTAGLQLADIAAGIVRQYKINMLDEKEDDKIGLYESRLKNLYSILRERSIERTIGSYTVRGFFTPEKVYSV